jgi:excisionase family DNA binding protein
MNYTTELLHEIPEFQTPSEICSRLRISRAKLFRMLKAGQLDSVKIGGTRLIAASQYIAFVERLLGR